MVQKQHDVTPYRHIWDGFTAEFPPVHIDCEDLISPEFWRETEDLMRTQVRQVCGPTPHRPRPHRASIFGN